jgi:flavin-dependent dehydrogenase
VNDELTSVGVVFPTTYFKKTGMTKEQMMLNECRRMTPVLSDRLPDLTPQEPIHAIPNFSYRVRNYTGKGFLCVGDAHRFIDPIFAYGVYFGIQEGQFAADAIAKHLSGEVKTNGNPFADFEALCDEGNDVVEDVIGVLWEYPLAFQRIVTWRDKVDSLDLLAGRILRRRSAQKPGPARDAQADGDPGARTRGSRRGGKSLLRGFAVRRCRLGANSSPHFPR